MKGKKRTKAKINKKYKCNIASSITIFMLIATVLVCAFYMKKIKTSINIRGEFMHAYATNTKVETDTQAPYTIVYEYEDTNQDLVYDTCRVTISTVYSQFLPNGWAILGQEGNNNTEGMNGYSIVKDYHANVSEEVVSLGRDNVTITVDKILSGSFTEQGVTNSANCSMEYIYTVEDNIIRQCQVKIRITGTAIITPPRDWITLDYETMTRTFTEDTEFILTDDDYNSIIKVGDIRISITKIGNFMDKTKNHTIQFEDKNLYDAMIENTNIKDKIVSQDSTRKQMVMTGENIEKVTTLQLNNKNISDLRGIGNFTKLKNLSVSTNQITDLAEVNQLSNLVILNGDNNQITSLESLDGLRNLTYLSLVNNKITKVDSQLALDNIDYLVFSRNEIKDITPLTNKLKRIGRTTLARFALDENAIQDISDLEGISYQERSGVHQQSIHQEVNTLESVILPQIIQKAISDNAEIIYTNCTKKDNQSVRINDDVDINQEISVQVKSHQVDKWSVTGTKLTIIPKDIPSIILTNPVLAEDTYTRLDTDHTILLRIRGMNIAEDILRNAQVKIKIGNQVIHEGRLADVFDPIEHQEFNLELGDTGTSLKDGRLTIEISAIEGMIRHTILDTKYIVDNKPPHVTIAYNYVENGKVQMTMMTNDDDHINKIIEDGQEYYVQYSENGLMTGIYPSEGWECTRISNYLVKKYDTPGNKTITLIDFAGNEQIINFTVDGWISEIKLNDPEGIYIQADTVTVIAKYIGDDMALNETQKVQLKYAIGTGQERIVEGKKNIDQNTITFTIPIEHNDIGELLYKGIQGIRIDRSVIPDFRSIIIKQLKEIEITPPIKTTYEEGEKLDLTGLKVMARYTDNTTKEIDDQDYTITAVNGEVLAEEGTKTITITYKGETASCQVTVTKPTTDPGDDNNGDGDNDNDNNDNDNNDNDNNDNDNNDNDNNDNDNNDNDNNDNDNNDNDNNDNDNNDNDNNDNDNNDNDNNDNDNNGNGNSSNNQNGAQNHFSPNISKTNMVKNEIKSSTSKLPNTGLKENIRIICIIICIIIAIVAWIKNKKYEIK